MAIIQDAHVEWRVVERLRELLDKLPQAEHDVTLTYSLFTTILCWTCQRIRAGDHAAPVWNSLKKELAVEHPRSLSDVQPRARSEGETLRTLPASRLIVSLRNGAAHGDDRKVKPLHTVAKGADRRLVGFLIETDFYDEQQNSRDLPRWGRWTIPMLNIHMRRVGLTLAERFCAQIGKDSQADAKQHVRMS